MFGKWFASAYTGSMFGAGSTVFAVWGYVVAHAKQGQVELNPLLLAAILGDSVENISKAIELLCAPDPNSRSKLEDGRRLIREGQFAFRVPTYFHYRRIRDDEDRRAYNRQKKTESRQRASIRESTMSAQAEAEVESEVEAEFAVGEYERDVKGGALGKSEVPKQSPLLKPSASTNLDSTPENLHPTNYAAKILEEIQFPHTQNNLRTVAAAIQAEVKAGKTPASAYEFVLAGTLDAKREGLEINNFFFGDAKYRVENRSNGHGRETVAEKNRRALDEYNKRVAGASH